MAMAAQQIVAEKLTITGSVGVVTAKFNLEELYRRIGFAKETISRGRCTSRTHKLSFPFSSET